MKNNILFLSIALLLITVSCKKNEGEGGRSSIQGHVYAKDYNASFTQLLSQFYAAGESVYIIYGDNEFYDDKVKTDPNGMFEFKNLRKGNYQLFVYSKDTTFTIPSGEEAIYINAEITNKEEVVLLPDFEIIK